MLRGKMQSASCFSSSPLVPNLWNVHFVNLRKIKYKHPFFFSISFWWPGAQSHHQWTKGIWETVWTQNGGAGSQTIRAIKTGQEIESGHYDVSWMLLGHGNTNGCHLSPYKDQGSVKSKPIWGCYYKKVNQDSIVCWEVKSCIWPLPKLAHFSC